MKFGLNLSNLWPVNAVLLSRPDSEHRGENGLNSAIQVWPFHTVAPSYISFLTKVFVIIQPCIYETEALCWIKRRVIKLRLMARKALNCHLPHILHSPFPQEWIFKRNSHNTLSRRKSQIWGG